MARVAENVEVNGNGLKCHMDAQFGMNVFSDGGSCGSADSTTRNRHVGRQNAVETHRSSGRVATISADNRIDELPLS
jgi:hypothetical protein